MSGILFKYFLFKCLEILNRIPESSRNWGSVCYWGHLLEKPQLGSLASVKEITLTPALFSPLTANAGQTKSGSFIASRAFLSISHPNCPPLGLTDASNLKHEFLQPLLAPHKAEKNRADSGLTLEGNAQWGIACPWDPRCRRETWKLKEGRELPAVNSRHWFSPSPCQGEEFWCRTALMLYCLLARISCLSLVSKVQGTNTMAAIMFRVVITRVLQEERPSRGARSLLSWMYKSILASRRNALELRLSFQYWWGGGRGEDSRTLDFA